MYALLGWNSPDADPTLKNPDVEIRFGLFVECQSLMCGYYEPAATEELAIELRRQHREWHEEGCPRL